MSAVRDGSEHNRNVANDKRLCRSLALPAPRPRCFAGAAVGFFENVYDWLLPLREADQIHDLVCRVRRGSSCVNDVLDCTDAAERNS